MTSLARQLERLAVPHTQAILADDRKRVSLLFDPKEAANLDRSEVLQIGINGLMELCARDDSFAKYKSTLYERNAEGFERSLQTKEINQRLDQVIREFLIHLSPYFLLSAAHKALEWLICRYHIHLYNVDDILLCILPYHDTMIFVRVVQLLKISNPTSKWNWLEPIQKPGVPLPAATLITHCYKDVDFFNFVCSMVPEFIKVFGTDSPRSPLNVVLAFYTTALVGALGAAPAVTDSLVAPLMPFLVRGLKSRCIDYRAATYTIVAQLLSRATLQSSVLEALLAVLLRHVPAKLSFEGIAITALVFDTQKMVSLPRKAFKYLCRVPGIVQSLVQLHACGALAALLPHLLHHLVPAALSDGAGTASAASSDGGHDDRLPQAGPAQYAALLNGFLDDAKLQHDDAALVIRLLVESFVRARSSDVVETENDESVTERIASVFKKLEKRYALAVDTVMQQSLASKEIDSSLLREFVGLSLSTKVRHAPVPGAQENLSLLLALNHADESHRVLGVQQLLSIVSSMAVQEHDGEFVQRSLLTRLSDDDSVSVVSAVLEMEPTTLRSVLGREGLLFATRKLLRRQPSDAWRPCWHTCFRVLLGGPWQDVPTKMSHSVMAVVLSLAANEEGDGSVLKDIVLTSDFAKQGLLHEASSDHAKAKRGRSKGGKHAHFSDLLIEKLAEALSSQPDDELASFATVALEAAADDSKLGILLLGVFSSVVGQCGGGDPDADRTVSAVSCVQWCLQLASALLPKAICKAEGDDLAAIAGSLRKVTGYCQLPAVTGDLSWWLPAAPADGGSEQCQGLTALVTVFKLLTQCAATAAGGPRQLECQSLLSSFLKDKFTESRQWMHFMCCMWLEGLSLDSYGQITLGGDASVTTRSLLVSRAIFSRSLAAKQTVLALDSSHCVVPALTILLGHPSACVRTAALGCVKAALAAANSAGEAFAGQALLVHLESSAAELIADPRHVQQAVATLLERSSATGRKHKGSPEQAAVGLLFNAACSEQTPLSLVTALLGLFRACPSPLIFGRLLPVLQRLVQKNPDGSESRPRCTAAVTAVVNQALQYCDAAVAATFVSRTDQGWSTFIEAIDMSCSAGGLIKTPQMTAIGQVTKEFFKSLSNDELKQQLLTRLFDVWLESDTAVLHSTIGHALRALTLDARLLVHELQPLVKPEADVTVKAKRMKRTTDVTLPTDGSAELTLNSRQWRRSVLILELLQTKKKLRNAQVLIPVFFGILARCLDTEKSDEEAEYIKQLLLGCIHHACIKVMPKEGLQAPAGAAAELITEQLFNIELIVQCIRTSPSAQTHQRALLLLSLAAGLFPEHVLHNVMAIFTFMGANIMRQDDAYSFEVIGRTLDAVVPRLVEASHRKGAGDGAASAAVSSVVRVFVDAFPHVPEHRRLALFSRLVNTLRPDENLWLVMALLTERHAVLMQASANAQPAPPVAEALTTELDTPKSAILDFQLLLTMDYTAAVIAKNLQRLLAYLGQLPEDNENLKGIRQPLKTRPLSKKLAAPARSDEAEQELISLETLTSAQLRLFKYAATGYIISCLSSPHFADKISAENAGGHITAQLQALLEQSLQYITVVSKSMDKHSSSPTLKFWKALVHRAYDILDKINALLPGDVFVSVVASLLRHSSMAMQRKAMQLLNGRLQKANQWQMSHQEVELLLAVAEQLGATVLATPPAKINSENETAINTQTALYTLKLLASALAFDNPDKFKVMVSPLARLIAKVEESKAVLASLFLCLAELVLCLRVHVIACLPTIMPALLRVLADEASLTSNDLLWLSVVTTAQKAVDAVPNFLSPYIPQLLQATVRLTCVAASGAAGSSASAEVPTNTAHVAPTSSTRSQLCQRLRMLRDRLAICIAPRVLIPAVGECYGLLTTSATMAPAGDALRSGGVAAVMDILSAHVGSLSKEDLQHFSGQLLNFFLVALDFRTTYPELDLDVIGSTEKHIFTALVSMVMRLSEATFRPMYFKLYDWACRQGQSKERLLVFYRLSDSIADKLKGLFCLFAGHVVKNAAELLTSCHSSRQGDTLFGKATDTNVKKSCLLADGILDTLHKCFLFDNEGFTTKERFDTLMQPLVDQLDNTLGSKEDFDARTTAHLIPCISQLAVAVADDSLWKPLNYQVCLKTRHSLPMVRMAALRAIRALNSKLAQDYLPLLPETIPFLAELMEDESTDVETLCQEVIADMEEVLGEPLQKYF